MAVPARLPGQTKEEHKALYGKQIEECWVDEWIDCSEPLPPLPKPREDIRKLSPGRWVTPDGFVLRIQRGEDGKVPLETLVIRDAKTHAKLSWEYLRSLPDEIKIRLIDDVEEAHFREYEQITLQMVLRIQDEELE